MKIWLDAHLSCDLATWLVEKFGVDAVCAREMGMQAASDQEIFEKGRRLGWVVMTKDRDFPDMVRRLGTPPRVIWLRCGNTSNEAMRKLLDDKFESAWSGVVAGKQIVEVFGE